MSRDQELKVDASLVKQMIARQFPQWGDLPVSLVDSAGTDNAIFRLGTDMAIRLPRFEWAVKQVHKEQQWLPQFVPVLPMPIPTPLAMGIPDDLFPWHWSVYRWLEGENATKGWIDDLNEAALSLAHFLSALQQVDPTGGPEGSNRGVPLVRKEEYVRDALVSLHSTMDTQMAAMIWEESLQAPEWQGPPVWIHGDLHPGNLLVEDGKLSAIIDFGTLCVGDPACDLLVAWTLLCEESRETLRSELSVDEATWARGRGWALSFGLINVAYYTNDTNPVLVKISQRAIDEVLADYKRRT